MADSFPCTHVFPLCSHLPLLLAAPCSSSPQGDLTPEEENFIRVMKKWAEY